MVKNLINVSSLHVARKFLEAEEEKRKMMMMKTGHHVFLIYAA